MSSESFAEAMSERELEEFVYGVGLVRSCAEDFAGSDFRADIQLKVCGKAEQIVAEVRRCHTEAAKLREEAQSLRTLNGDLRKARDRAVARLREEENNRAWERTRAEELVMCKSRELAELRRRVESLEGALRKCLTYLTTAIDGMRRRRPELIPEAGLVEEALEEEVRAALSQASAQTKQETRSEEDAP